MTYATVNGLTLYYKTHGRGQPLVLLRGTAWYSGPTERPLNGLPGYRTAWRRTRQSAPAASTAAPDAGSQTCQAGIGGIP